MLSEETPDCPSASDGVSGPLRRELVARARGLRSSIHIGGRGLTDGIIAQIRQALRKRDLIKIKVHVEKGADADDIGRRLARKVPCHFVQRIGKVLVVFSPANEPRSP